MHVLAFLGGLALIFIVLVDGIEAMILPRRVTRPYRPARFFYRNAWRMWLLLARRMKPGKHREAFLSYFGPLSILGLFAAWFIGLITGFGVLHWSVGTALNLPEDRADLAAYLYMSGSTFFTLGLGDVTTVTALGRVLTVAEAGLGFGFLAGVIGYLPVLFQAFSRREVMISLLDARAGSPPTSGELLRRLGQARNLEALGPFLAEWERWAAELLEGHLSFPVLSYYRSQHENQSWLAAITCILDTCAVLLVWVKNVEPFQSQLTFAMARHAVVDLALVFKTPPQAPSANRLGADLLQELRKRLNESGLELREGEAFDARLAELRALYEPFVNALARQFLFALPPFLHDHVIVDNWQTTAWTRRSPGIGNLPVGEGNGHFD
jgi:hypothetical protein